MQTKKIAQDRLVVVAAKNHPDLARHEYGDLRYVLATKHFTPRAVQALY